MRRCGGEPVLPRQLQFLLGFGDAETQPANERPADRMDGLWRVVAMVIARHRQSGRGGLVRRD